MWRSLVAVCAVALIVGACASRAGDGELTVFAASSLRDVFLDLGDAYGTSNRDVSLTFSFDATNALRAQIEQGARADVFAAADATTPQGLTDAGLAAAPVVFAGNHLAIVTPAGDTRIDEPADLARPGLRVVAAAADVPITRYADRALDRLGRLPGSGPRFADRVHENVVSREDNVRAVLAKIELGEGDAAIVYASDAAASDAVRIVAIPAAADVTVSYAAVSIRGSEHPELAAAFVEWLSGPDPVPHLRSHGFTTPPDPP
jgi:molybdate transport system substrate-binding protein